MKLLIFIAIVFSAQFCFGQSLPSVSKSNLDYRNLDTSYSVVIYQDSGNIETTWFATAAAIELNERGIYKVTIIKTDLSGIELAPREMAFYDLPNEKQYQIWFKKR